IPLCDKQRVKGNVIPLRASSEVKLKEAPAVNEDVVAQYKTRPLSVRPSLNTPHDRV
uniref:Uncharacterized protein n=1 Tax=Gasterosteus aculeatus TaxID=69293 RepID=G3PQP0_GASAC